MKIYKVADVKPQNEENNYHAKVGHNYLFEYHCYEGHDSSDAQLWYRSHQPVTVIAVLEEGNGKNEQERADNGQPAMFKVKFADGFEGDVFEDEILDSASEFCRPDPPKNPNKKTQNENI